ncbi:MAG: dynamin family protein [Deltaproteobacteria bacterium]|nr:dynamin family protein [Deltaproteobacteria bacterium]
MPPELTGVIRNNARRLIEIIGNVRNRFHFSSLNRQIEACQSLVADAKPLDVAVVGQFKAGKSSFINSLIGREILPMGVIPVTTAITCLQYGPRDRAFISFFDGKQEEIDLSELENYISESRNPSNGKKVAIVNVELPSFADYPGIRLIDTPGLGSVFSDHIKTAENWFPEIGVATLAVSADRPLSDDDLELLRELNRYTPRIVLLITKVDLLTGDQRDEVAGFIAKTLKQELKKAFDLYCYSTRLQTETFRRRLMMECLSDLSKNCAEESDRILAHKALSLTTAATGYLTIALKTSREKDRDRQSLKKEILDETVNFDQIREELWLISKERRRQTRAVIMDCLNQLENSLLRKVKDNLSRDMAGWKGNLWKLTRRYEEWVAETMTAEMREISQSEHGRFYATLEKSHANIARSLENFRMHLKNNIDKVLGVKLAEAEWTLDVAAPGHPDIKAVRSFDYHFDLIWFCIPMAIFRPLFEKHFLRRIEWEAKANLSRLASQWETIINRRIDDMRKETLRQVEDELATVTHLLSSKAGETEEIETLIVNVREAAKELKA